MTRETKVGLVVTASFLTLVGVVVASKLRDPNIPLRGSEAWAAEEPPRPEKKPETVSPPKKDDKKAGKPAAKESPRPLASAVEEEAKEVVQAGFEKPARGVSPPETAPSAVPAIEPPPPPPTAEKAKPVPEVKEESGLPAPPPLEGPPPVKEEKKSAEPLAVAPPAPPAAPPAPPAEPMGGGGLPAPVEPVPEVKVSPIVGGEKKKEEPAGPLPSPVPGLPEPPKEPVAPAAALPVASPVPGTPEAPKEEKKPEKEAPPVPMAAPVVPEPVPTPLPTPGSEPEKQEPGKVTPPTPASVGVSPPPGIPETPPPLKERTTPVPAVTPEPTSPVPGIGKEQPREEPSAIPKKIENRIVPEPTPVPGAPPVVARAGDSRPAQNLQPEVVRFTETEHRAKAGETFATVSRAFYKSEAYAEALRLYNQNDALSGPPALEKDGTLRVNEVVSVPELHILEKRYADKVPRLKPLPGSEEPSEGGDVIRRTSGSSTQGPSYKVPGPAPGQLMREIARLTLGNGERWRDIYQLNRSFDPLYAVPPGTVLTLPADAKVPAEARGS